jgi:Hg(II)-responsive transcriptional regulator
MERITVGDLARRAGVHVETVRFYERKGVLPPPQRAESGYRLYSPEAVTRLRFVKRAQELGFTLREITALLALWEDPAATCAHVKHQAEEKLADIRRRIRALRRMEEALEALARTCSGGQRPMAECPILDALSESRGAGR